MVRYTFQGLTPLAIDFRRSAAEIPAFFIRVYRMHPQRFPLHARLLLLLCGLAIALTAHRCTAAEAPKAAPKKIALLVGINKYEKRGFRDLQYAERDVAELTKVLVPAGYQVYLLTGSSDGNRRATLTNIQKAVDVVLRARTKNDLILVALAGHGLQAEVPGPDRKLQAESFFCPCDAEQGNPKTMLSIGWLFGEIDRRGGGRNLLLVDACREDPTRGRGMDGGTVKTLPEGVAVLFGCCAGQKTFETKNAGGGHGVFFHYVLEGLRGQARNEVGEVTWNRLVEYVSQKVTRETPRLLKDSAIEQTPNLIANLPGVPPVLLPASRKTPALLAAPFNEATAKARQLEWARHLGKANFVDTNSLAMRLALVPPGTFLMGSTAAEVERAKSNSPEAKPEWFAYEKQHRVRLTRPYYLGMHEVTVGQFRMFVDASGHKTDAERDGQGVGYSESEAKLAKGPKFTWKNPGWPQTSDHPVVNVSWNDADAFCRWLSKREGRTYRLPTEAEWEYACRAGTTTQFNCGDAEGSLHLAGNTGDQSFRLKHRLAPLEGSWDDGNAFTAPIGRFKPNAFGLYDMHGNVWEWCQDTFWQDYEALPIDNPANLAAGPARSIRGGSWNNLSWACRSAFRNADAPGYRGHDLGFRVVAVEPR
jgi:sulfatase modifying factor 1